MTTYSYAQLEGLWIAAGGSRATAPIAAAIAEAESGGNSDAYNPKDKNGWPSAGLWQINNAAPAPAGWADPATNARLAVAKWKASGFNPWGTFTSGAYKAYLSGKTTPATNVPGSPTAATSAAVAAAAADCFIPNPLSVSVPVIGSISAGPVCLMSRSQARAVFAVLVIASGVIGLGIGLYFVGVRSRPGKAAMNMILSFVPGEGAGAAARQEAQQAKDDAEMEKRLGSGPSEETDMEVRGGTVRETDIQRQQRRRRERTRAGATIGSGGPPATEAEAGF